MKSNRTEIWVTDYRLDLERAADEPEQEEVFDTNTKKALEIY
jgi:hypothetical protein